jgi:hypothetical protein
MCDNVKNSRYRLEIIKMVKITAKVYRRECLVRPAIRPAKG